MTYKPIPYDPDLIALWDMEQQIAGKIFDSGGGGFEATLNGNPRQGRDRFGSYLGFDGVSGSLSIGNIGAAKTGLFVFKMPSLPTGEPPFYVASFNTGATNYISIESGEVEVYGISSPSVYIGGELEAMVTADKMIMLAVTSATAFDCDVVSLSNLLACNFYTAAIYNKAKSAAWIEQEWKRFLSFQG